MKHLLLLTLSVLLLVSCEKELGELTEYESPRIVINALLKAPQDEQPLYLRMTGLTHTSRVEGASVSLFLNGEPYYQHLTEGEDSLLISTRSFKVGDEVSIEVRKDEFRASATAQVLPPISITGIDTLTVMAKRYSTSTDLETHRRLLIHLRQPEDLNPDETYFYRVEIEKEILVPASWSLIGDTVTDVSYKSNEDHHHFSYASDPALSESEGVDQENFSVSFDWLEGMKNLFHVFRSTYFDHGEYTLRLDLPYPNSSRGWSQDVTIRLYTISRTEYNYLMALSAYKTLDSETIYDTEPGITTNVRGGAGFFGIESISTISIHDDHNLLKNGDRY